MAKYKPDQGTYARTTAVALLGALLLYGAWTLYYFLLSFRGAEGGPGFMARDLSGGPFPVLGTPVTPALISASVVGAGLIVVLVRALNTPRVADMLIESETEMRKCTWPTWNETFTASIVILVVMVAFTGLLSLIDYLLNEAMTGWVF